MCSNIDSSEDRKDMTSIYKTSHKKQRNYVFDTTKWLDKVAKLLQAQEVCQRFAIDIDIDAGNIWKLE